MSYSFMGMGSFLIMLPVLIAQWIGITGLGKANRNAAWKCMLAGICLSTFAALISSGLVNLFLSFLPIGEQITSRNSSRTPAVLGPLLFAIGFALHGSHAARSSQRVTELEAIAAAQGEELNRLRATQGSAS